MDMKFGKITDRELMNRLYRAGRRSAGVIRTALRRAVKPLQVDMKDHAPVKTGATKRSVGSLNTKTGIKVGVRPFWEDKKTGKIPSKYAKRVNTKTHWFEEAYDRHKDAIPARMLKEAYDNLIKKGL